MKFKLLASKGVTDRRAEMVRQALILLGRARTYPAMADHFCSGAEHNDHRFLVRESVRSRLNSFATSVTRDIGIIFGGESEQFRQSSGFQRALEEAHGSVNEVMRQINHARVQFLERARASGSGDPSMDAFLDEPKYIELKPELETRLNAFHLALIDFVGFHEELHI